MKVFTVVENCEFPFSSHDFTIAVKYAFIWFYMDIIIKLMACFYDPLCSLERILWWMGLYSIQSHNISSMRLKAVPKPRIKPETPSHWF